MRIRAANSCGTLIRQPASELRSAQHQFPAIAVRCWFIDRLTPGQLDAVADIADTVLAAF